MTGQIFQVFQCANPVCAFRFPRTPTDRDFNFCPVCGSPGESRGYEVPDPESPQDCGANPRPVVEVLLDNIRSTFNVGSIFRTADGSGIQKLYLGGYTPTPEHPKLKKTGLGAEWVVPWEPVPNGFRFVQARKDAGYRIWALESTPEAVPLFNSRLSPLDYPVLLVIGNEKVGVDPEILNLCDRIVFIPMFGYKRSLNVSNAFGIAAYFITGISR